MPAELHGLIYLYRIIHVEYPDNRNTLFVVDALLPFPTIVPRWCIYANNSCPDSILITPALDLSMYYISPPIDKLRPSHMLQ